MTTALKFRQQPVSSSQQDSAILRYQRVARVEAILTIREQQQRSARQAVLWTTVALLSILGCATAGGWL